VRTPLLKVALAEGFAHRGAIEDLRRHQRIDEPGLAQIHQAFGLEAPATTAGPTMRRPGGCRLVRIECEHLALSHEALHGMPAA